MISSDSVSKFFLLYQRGGAMHFDGCKGLDEIVERAIRIDVSLYNRADFDKRISDYQAIINKVIAERDSDDANDLYIEHRNKCGSCQGVDLTNEPYARCGVGRRLKEACRAD